MTGGQELALTIAIAVTCWLAGRLAAPRIAPWRRMSVGITVLVLAVVLLISLNYSLELLVGEEEMASRRAAMKLRPEPEREGYLKRYAKNVSSADLGAVII